MGIPPRGRHRWKSRLMWVSSTLTTRQVTIGKWRLNPPRRKLMSPGNNPPPAPMRGPSHQTKAPSAAIESPATTRSFPNPCTPKPCPRSSPGATVHPPRRAKVGDSSGRLQGVRSSASAAVFQRDRSRVGRSGHGNPEPEPFERVNEARETQ